MSEAGTADIRDKSNNLETKGEVLTRCTFKKSIAMIRGLATTSCPKTRRKSFVGSLQHSKEAVFAEPAQSKRWFGITANKKDDLQGLCNCFCSLANCRRAR